VRSLPGRLLVGLVQIYRLAISPVMAPSCRYWPSCSEYAIDALRRHGAARGSWLTARRLCRCHPWSAGGIDEVPEPRSRGGDGAATNSPFARSSAAADLASFTNPTNSTNSNTRWRAYLGEPHRDHPDSASS
jgi:putative membrane protein insertion efficiency factor